jgi:hypothetical protein
VCLIRLVVDNVVVDVVNGCRVGSNPASVLAHDHVVEPWVVLTGARRSGMPLSC